MIFNHILQQELSRLGLIGSVSLVRSGTSFLLFEAPLESQSLPSFVTVCLETLTADFRDSCRGLDNSLISNYIPDFMCCCLVQFPPLSASLA